MRRDVRRLVLDFASHAIASVPESDGFWDEVERALGREASVQESREVSALAAKEALKFKRRAIRLQRGRP